MSGPGKPWSPCSRCCSPSRTTTRRRSWRRRSSSRSSTSRPSPACWSIPRSLALTLYGDLDVTQLRERPPGRGTVKTALRTEAARQKIYDFIRAECVAGRQAYVIYPVIDESERADLKAATVMAERLAKVFPELEVGLVHGRLKAEERDAT